MAGPQARKLGLTYLFISHDLSMVRHLSDRVAVMYLGRIVELATADDLFRAPAHPYTQALLSAVPAPVRGDAAMPGRIVLQGAPPDPSRPPGGCSSTPVPVCDGRVPRADSGSCAT